MGFATPIGSIVTSALSNAAGLLGDFGPVVGIFLAITIAGMVLAVVVGRVLS
jgi:hypothetical protein